MATKPEIVSEGTPPKFNANSPALCLQVHACDGQARASTMHLPHGPVKLPIFMPVGTKGTIKSLTSRQLDRPELSPQIILGNTYHLALQPGTDLLSELGGLHNFMSWPRNLLTDSGGFQMVSLLELAEITEEGVTFRSPLDGTSMLLRPEDSIRHQNNIGSDIMMQLDDVVSSVTVDDDRFEEACHRTLRWLDRCIAANAHPEKQNLFGIVQGGLDTSPGGLREVNLKGMVERDLPGYAVGGLAGGEAKEPFWRVVHMCCQGLPPNKPRYLMGVGYPLDLVVCVALGIDMFDCVYPTRTARFGVALLDSGTLKLKGKGCEHDARPIHGGAPLHGPPLPPPPSLLNQQPASRSQAKKDNRGESSGKMSPKKKQRIEAAQTAAAGAARSEAGVGAGNEAEGAETVSNGNGIKGNHQSKGTDENQKETDSAEAAATTATYWSAHVKGEAPPPCRCQACEGYSRASLCALFKGPGEPLACQLVTQHNLAYMLGLSRRMRAAIQRNKYPAFVHAFLRAHFGVSAKEARSGNTAANKSEPETHVAEDATGNSANENGSSSGCNTDGNGLLLEVPKWVEDALAAAGCDWRAAEPEWTPVEAEAE